MSWAVGWVLILIQQFKGNISGDRSFGRRESQTLELQHGNHYDTGWFKHKTPNSFRVQCPRRFWEIRPWIFAHVFNVPPPSLSRMYLGVFFKYIFGSWGPRISDEPPPHKNVIGKKARQGHIKHVCKILGSISQNGVDIWNFCAVKCKHHG